MATQSVENITAKNVAIARAAYEAYVTKDRAALADLIAEDFHFTSPLDNRLDREAYFRRCWPNSEVIAGFDFIHVVTDAERVFVTHGQMAPLVQWLNEHGIEAHAMKTEFEGEAGAEEAGA